MKIKRYAGITILTLFLFIGCTGNNANIKNLSESEAKAIQQKLLDNWSEYNIRYNNLVIALDPKNDDKKILVDNYWSTVKDQKTWTQLVNGTNILPYGQVNQVWGNEIREIWVPDNRFYGYVTHQPNELISAQIVDENTVRLIHTRSHDRRVWN